MLYFQWLLFRESSVYSPQGNAVGVVAGTIISSPFTLTDVSARKQARKLRLIMRLPVLWDVVVEVLVDEFSEVPLFVDSVVFWEEEEEFDVPLFVLWDVPLFVL